eukprot:GFUD01011377.1.p1 GENE.GFUD01011377.1~~GFUD01011377.1.p1  ORF type:complete len:900 (-),score=228.82 GFUD01011377.1:79-2778(-)
MRKYLFFVVFLIPLVLGSEEEEVSVKRGKPLVIEGTVSGSSDKVYLIHTSSSAPVRVQSEVIWPDNRQHPVVFMIRTENSVKSWRIPSKSSGNSSEYGGTLCRGSAVMKLIISTNSEDTQEFKVNVTIKDPEEIIIKPGQINSKPALISPTTQQLFQFNFTGQREDQFLLKVTSKQENPVCSLVSVQPLENCPEDLYDEEKDMRYGGSTVFQTMLKVTAIVILKKDYPKGVNIVILAKSSDSDCYLKTESHGVPLDRSMEVTISIEYLSEDPVLSTCAVLLFYLVIGLLGGGLSLFTYRTFGFEFDGKFRKQEVRLSHRVKSAVTKTKSKSISMSQLSEPAEEADEMRLNSVVSSRSISMNQFEYENHADANPDEIVESPEERDSKCISGDELNQQNTTTDGVKLKFKQPSKFFWQNPLPPPDQADAPTTGTQTTHNLLFNNVMRSRHPSENTETSGLKVKKIVTLDLTEILKKRANRKEVTVADMAVHYNKEYFPNFMRMRSELFLWLILLAGIYYTLPVFQLVYYYQETSIRSGDLDTCYYNYLCLYPWGPFADYGHVFSNVGYVISGLIFMAIVRKRSYKYDKLCSNPIFREEDLKMNHPKFTGVPETYGIFYALGAALTFEGVLSGCYHVCPTAVNFQFDTTFMYVISVLVFLKVYQFRHSDITQTAHLVFLVIGVALIVEVIGIFTSSEFFWIIFVTGYITFVIIFINQVYYNGTGPNLFQRVKSLLTGKCSESPTKVLYKKLVPTILILLVNIAMAVFFFYKRKPGVSRYILSIMMVNMVLYIIYYLSNKIYYRFRTNNWKPSEGLRILTCLYGVASLLFMAGAVFFFLKELKTSAGTPAESRNLNDSCYMLIFDNHDMWHFLSAAGLFYLFMFILTIEDYNMPQPRNTIPVF